jgi:hypothetical protein
MAPARLTHTLSRCREHKLSLLFVFKNFCLKTESESRKFQSLKGKIDTFDQFDIDVGQSPTTTTNHSPTTHQCLLVARIGWRLCKSGRRCTL